ncbi:MAG: FHA domain-containing protein [Acidaminococcales bacterium]|jgi:pSer/pThr/pTyr-binding forkhead associated (FHA) protein|nr:FHA domain-containing protein [Acidaminococcales bacterium]
MFFLRKIFPAAGARRTKNAFLGARAGEGEGGDQRTKIFFRAVKMPEQKRALPAVLKVVSGKDAGLEISFESGQVNIGRMAGSELLLSDISVSRLHAFIVNENGRHVLYDGKSTNGTFLNGQRISQKILRHGDLIKTGNTVIVYELQ